jgi:hypothetical protein
VLGTVLYADPHPGTAPLNQDFRWTMTGTLSTKTFLKDLSEARSAGRVQIDVDFNRVCDPRSPLPFESLKGRIVYLYLGFLVVIGAATRLGFGAGWTVVLEVLAGFSLVYWLAVRRALEAWAKRRIIAALLASEDAWEKIWRFGGITLRLVGPESATWVAPKDRWKDAYEHFRA